MLLKKKELEAEAQAKAKEANQAMADLNVLQGRIAMLDDLLK